MLGLKKKLFSEKSKTQKFVFENFGLYREEKDSLCGTESKNCDCKDGILKTGMGGKPFVSFNGMNVVAPTVEDGQNGVQNIFVFSVVSADNTLQEEKIFAITKKGMLYAYDFMNSAWIKLCETGWGARLVCVYGADKTYRFVAVGWRFAKVISGDLSEIETVSEMAFKGVCVCKNRIFFVEGTNALRYSDPATPWDFTSTIDDGGIIRLPTDMGEIAELVAVEESVYAIFQRGIVRIKTAGKARDFVMTKIPYSGGKILYCSALALGGKGVFLATDGLYAIDGDSVSRVCAHLPIKAVWEATLDCAQAVFKGKGFWKYTDENGEEKTVVVDEDLKSGYFMDGLDGFGGSDGRALFKKEDFVYELCLDGDLPEGGEYFFQTGKQDFGSSKRKRLKSLTFEGEGSFVLGITCQNEYLERTVRFEQGKAIVQTAERGKDFVFYLETRQRHERAEDDGGNRHASVKGGKYGNRYYFLYRRTVRAVDRGANFTGAFCAVEEKPTCQRFGGKITDGKGEACQKRNFDFGDMGID